METSVVKTPRAKKFVDPSKVVSQFHLKQGDVVADLGSGVGHFIPEISKRIGNEGEVYAIDIQRCFIDKLGDYITREGLDNVDVRWCDLEAEGSCNLDEGSLDVGILVNTLFQLENKKVFAKEISQLVRSGGRLMVIDWSESFAGMGPKPEDVYEKTKAIDLFEEAGFVLEREFDAGEHHYGLAFRKT